MSLVPIPLPSSGPQVTALQNALGALGFTFPPAEIGSQEKASLVTQAAVRSFARTEGFRPYSA
jgi:hypothetical protein